MNYRRYIKAEKSILKQKKSILKRKKYIKAEKSILKRKKYITAGKRKSRSRRIYRTKRLKHTENLSFSLAKHTLSKDVPLNF